MDYLDEMKDGPPVLWERSKLLRDCVDRKLLGIHHNGSEVTFDWEGMRAPFGFMRTRDSLSGALFLYWGLWE